MKLSGPAFVLAAFSLLSLSDPAHAVALSGVVLGPDGLGKSGVEVALKSGDQVTSMVLTGTDGTWMLDGTTRVTRSAERTALTSRLSLDPVGRLHLSFQGRDLSGRSIPGASRASFSAPRVLAARATAEAGVPDTLVYSFESRVFLRDTLTDLVQSGIKRAWDTTWNASRVYGYIQDSRDLKVYRTIAIGNQVWMAENLGYKRDTSWIMRDSAKLGEHYGRLYQWASAMDTSAAFLNDIAEIQLPWRGVCPQGWHLPSEAEWSVLVNLSDSATSGASLKALDFESDTSKALSPTDAWGFRVLSAGFVNYNQYAYRNVYMGFPGVAIFWSASEYTTTKSWSRTFTNTTNSAVRKLNLKTEGYSVRCIKD